MTREQFHELLHEPSTIRLNLIRDLEEITGHYPYFHNAHLLLAKQYKGHENIRFESYLRKASAYAPDRTILFNIIHQEPETVIHIGEETRHDSQKDNKYEPDFSQNTDQVVVDPAETKNQVSEEEITTEQGISIPASANTESTPSIAALGNEQKALTPHEILELRLKEIERGNKNIKSASGSKESSEKQQTAAKQATGETPPTIPVEKKRTTPPVKQTKASESTLAKEERGITVESKPKQSAEPASTHTFIEWLRLKQVPIENQKDYSVSPSNSNVTEETPTDQSDSLVEKFIKSEPRIVPARSEFYSPGNMARQSAVAHDDLISETLARIYANQGNIALAVETLQKLALKNPEKSRYFAALIEEFSARKPD